MGWRRGGGFLRLRGSCPLFTPHCGSRRLKLTTPLGERSGLPGKAAPPLPRRRWHWPPPTVPHGVGGIPVVMHRPRRIALHPVLLPGACCVRCGEASLPLAPLPVPRIPGPAERVGAASPAAVTGEQGPRLPGSPPPAVRVQRGGGGREATLWSYPPPIRIFHSVWASVKIPVRRLLWVQIASNCGPKFGLKDSGQGRVENKQFRPTEGAVPTRE